MVKNSDPKASGPGLEIRQDEENVLPGSGPGAELMQAVLAKPSTIGKSSIKPESRINGVVIGTLQSIAESGQVMVHYPGIPGDEPVTAITTEDMASQKTDSEVALGFVNGNPLQPVILGVIQKTTEVNQVTS